ncbi:hypothetical protein [Peribacillus sp. NPDC058075]
MVIATSRYPEAVKELIISDVTRGPAVVSMKESNETFELITIHRNIIG